MISRAEIIGYFEEIIEIEEKMRERYRRLHENVNRSEYKALFLALAEEEAVHINLVRSLIEIFGRKKDS